MSDRQKFYLIAGIFFRTKVEKEGKIGYFVEF